jgi:alpha-1,6-mannosyltransferase
MSVPRRNATVALTLLVVALAALAATAASSVSARLVPAAHSSFPGWLAGPLHGLPATGGFELLLIGSYACYLVVLRYADALSGRALWSGIVLATAAMALAPPLFSADVFGYISFARLGALHGLDPYTHAAFAVPHDPVYPYVGWPYAHSPYGPLFTIASYALVPLGIAGALWTLKGIAALASLATAALLWRSAQARGHSPQRAAALFALNPLLLAFAVGGAHNDVLLTLIVTGGLVLALAARERAGAVTLAAASAVKASAALALPFAILGGRRRGAATLAAILALLALAALSLAVFGGHSGALLGTLRGEQQFVAIHSLPSEVSRALGLGRLAGGVRAVFAVALVAAVAAALWQTWRRPQRWLECYGWSVLALLACTAWLLPWYGVWALAPAALSESRRLRVVTLVACAYLVATRLPFTDPLLG